MAFVYGDPDGIPHTMRADVETGAIVNISLKADGTFANGYDAAISAGGRYVVFEDYVRGEDYVGGILSAFVRDTETQDITRADIGENGALPNGDVSYSRSSLSADGCFVAFGSNSSNFVEDNNNGSPNVFVKDLQTGVLTRVSTAADGTQGNGSSYEASISADGRYVAFSSAASNLVLDDTNDWDIFVKD
ncbi:MAG: hypothetical protein IPK66_18080 [Rhodospirillales bacterium]|nr:hypothetical protein [Rhodospirillales bacterium]